MRISDSAEKHETAGRLDSTERRSEGLAADVWRRFRRHPGAMAGLLVLSLLMLVIILIIQIIVALMIFQRILVFMIIFMELLMMTVS